VAQLATEHAKQFPFAVNEYPAEQDAQIFA
jgi:hypothetical protein